jgi:serine/threonine protein kinase
MRRADTLFEDDGPVLGFIGSGLWRFVFVVDPRAVMEAPVVMKMMKSEHQVDKRNFDRHRRDALVMERTAGSPYVVDGYGFCGNTVLTEYLDSYLNNVIYEDDDSSSNGGGTHVTRETTEGRIRLALDVARGVAALHEVPGGPIVHADLQAKQFLITPDGTIKVNDFNRCRFMAHKNATGAKCPFYIPSAPGKMRSPEEYASEDLDEALDIYSVANIFYGIITGKPAWSEFTSSETKENVQRGVQPYIPDDLRKPGTADEALALLTQRAYTRDPQERITAPELVRELETLLDKVTKESSNG